MPSPESDKQHPQSSNLKASVNKGAEDYDQIKERHQAAIDVAQAYLDLLQASQDPARDGEVFEEAKRRVEESELRLHKCQSSHFSEKKTESVQPASPAKQAGCSN